MKNKIIWHYSSSWKPGFYKFHGQNRACWYRNVFGKDFKSVGVQTLSQFGLTHHRGVKFWRVFKPAEAGGTTGAHTLLQKQWGEFDFGAKKFSKRKECAKDVCARIRYYNGLQDLLFSEMATFLQLKDKNKVDWLFDLAYNRDEEQFDYIWENHIK
jgi:hypothetical protein